MNANGLHYYKLRVSFSRCKEILGRKLGASISQDRSPGAKLDGDRAKCDSMTGRAKGKCLKEDRSSSSAGGSRAPEASGSADSKMGADNDTGALRRNRARHSGAVINSVPYWHSILSPIGGQLTREREIA